MFDDLQAIGSLIGGFGVLGIAALVAVLKYGRRNGNNHSQYVTDNTFKSAIKEGRHLSEDRHRETLARLAEIADLTKENRQNLLEHITDNVRHQ
jgi:hypothetical protein